MQPCRYCLSRGRHAPTCKRPLCKHCGRLAATRPRGLCSKCYQTPGVREQYRKAIAWEGEDNLTQEQVDAIVAEQMQCLPPDFYRDHEPDHGREPYQRRVVPTRPTRKRSHVEGRA